MSEIADIAIAPLLPWSILVPLFVVATAAVAVAIALRARGAVWRLLAMAGLAVVLLNPSLVREVREPIADVAVVVVDRSPSQDLDDRRTRTDEALVAVQEALADMPDLDTRIVASDGAESVVEETHLFATVDEALADVPRRRVAGVILLTDGQVHDVPSDPTTLTSIGPVHALLTGRPDERDRRLSIIQAPSFGLVGQPLTITVKVEDLPVRGGGGMASVTVVHDDGEPSVFDVPVGVPTDLSFPLKHAGANVLELRVAPGHDELTLANNRAAAVVNGVRDRLRVLLVSGQPHSGERTWRSILKSDPSVDLVHFTILRPPEKQDGTPLGELSLISFPIRELFEVRLYEFDLIIFDRYQRRGVLPSLYLRNIADYVQAGGAFLEASGPHFASPFSLYRTPLGSVLPGEPTGEVVERGYRPRLTDLGQRHPVTADLAGAAQRWGRWLRQIEVVSRGGAIVMDGADGHPLLILDRVGEGRVAQLMSDHIWLWARGYEGGGPQAELLRRLAHWLMQEPELEEEVLRAEAADRQILIERRSLRDAEGTVEVTSPSGQTSTVMLEEEGPGRARARFVADEPGVFRIADGQRAAVAVVGSANPRELSDLRGADHLLAPVVEATGGSMVWLEADGMPTFRRVMPERDAAGRDWLGLRSNRDYLVSGVREVSLLPAALALLLCLGGLMTAWRREGA